jgi:excisionase family DNA binding protein
MGTPRQIRTGSLSAVEDTPTKTTAELAEGIQTRLAGAVVELEALRLEVAELAALACAPPASDRRVGIQLLTVRQTAVLLGLGQSTVHQMIRDGRLGSCKIGNSRRVPMTEIETFLSSLPGRRIGA